MKLSTRTRYGVRAMLELAQQEGHGPVTLKNIAANQEISIKYLEQLIAILRSAGLVRSVRGAKGGYLLAKPANKIKLSECFVALEGKVVTAECVTDKQMCDRTTDCAARYVWAKVQRAVMEILESMTLQDLIKKAASSKNQKKKK